MAWPKGKPRDPETRAKFLAKIATKKSYARWNARIKRLREAGLVPYAVVRLDRYDVERLEARLARMERGEIDSSEPT